MGSRTRVTEKGQITIPIDTRRDPGIAQGDQLEVVRQGDEIVLRRAGSVATHTVGIFARYRLPVPPSAEEERAAFEEAVAQDVMEELRDRARCADSSTPT